MPWAIKLASQNLLDGYRWGWAMEARVDPFAFVPYVFKTKEAARDFAKQRYGYIAKRKDLQREPHGWFPAKVVKVKIKLEEL